MLWDAMEGRIDRKRHISVNIYYSGKRIMIMDNIQNKRSHQQIKTYAKHCAYYRGLQ